MESKKLITNEFIYKTKMDRHRKQIYDYQKGKQGNKLGVWD